ncbi:MAG: YggS family pyridoxal phosphate-dependent enzyme [Verrucomicrobiota bacterium]
MISYDQFSENLTKVMARIRAASHQSSRDLDEISLLPVTKNHPVDAVEYAVRSGLPAVGENRVQEAADKRCSYADGVRWELIGHLQSNKAKLAVDNFDRIQSVDSAKILNRLQRFSEEADKVLPILIQCNTGKDPNKYGFPVDAMDVAVENALQASHLRLDGLMTIAPLDDDPDVAKAAFESLRDLRDRLAAKFGVPLSELSMGMTGDLEIAIAAGSTQIRVGTALYGARDYD